MQPSEDSVLNAARQAAQAWRAAMRVRREAKSMPPWDELKYFDTPLITNVALLANVDKVIAAQNPNRVGILFSTTGAAVGGLFVRPGSAQTNGTGSGLTLPSNNSPLQFTQSEWGNLVQAEWHGQSIGGAGTVYVVEVLLRIWSNG